MNDRTALTTLASTGFNTAIRLLSYKLNCTEDEALQTVADHFQRDIVQFENYRKYGLQPSLIEQFIKFLKKYDVAFGKHQLKPTKHMLAMHKWSKENGSK